MRHFLLISALFLSFHSFSQLQTDFNEPESLWQGNTDLFTCSPEGILEFISPENEAGDASVYYPVTYGKDMTWEIDVKADFHTTNANYARFYLYATGELFSDPLFYLQVGNNSRQISLYCKRSHTSVRCIEGRPGLLDEPYKYVRIRVTLENQHTWSLYTCKAGEEAFTFEGSYTANLENNRQAGFFNITCQYIKSRISIFYFDNIRIAPFITPFPDTIPDTDEPGGPTPPPAEDIPELVDILYNSSTSLLFQYNSSINIDNAIIHITGIGDAKQIRHGSSKNEVVAVFPEAISANQSYRVTIKGIASQVSGKILPEETWEISLEDESKDPDEDEEKPTDSISPGSILINEIMADPKGLELIPETEYVELYNTLSQQVSLDGWNFIYNGKTVPLDGIYLPANGYLILYREGRDIYTAPEAIAVGLTGFPANLANGGKDIQLTDNNNQVIDEVVYAKATAARSWERSTTGEWYLCNDPLGGTPGYKNSPVTPEEGTGQPRPPSYKDVRPGELIFNELLPEPFPEGSEYIELYNRSDRVLSFENISIATRKNDGTLSTKYSLKSIPGVIEPGSYIVISKDIEQVTAFYEANEEVLHQLKMPVLANTSSTLVLFRTDDELVIDEVSYSSKWHSAAIKNKKGVSLERIDPEVPTQNETNWTSASAMAGYGTPGFRNSQYSIEDKDGGITTGIDSPAYSEQTRDYTIKYVFEHPDYAVRIFIFDIHGRQVAHPVNNQTVGTNGAFYWGGTNQQGKYLPQGIYIMYAEAYHPTGDLKRFKKVFIIY